MTDALYDAVYTIPVPAGLNARVLAACRAQASQARPIPTAIRFVPAAVTVAACAAVLLVTLLSTGQMPGTQPPTESLGMPGIYTSGREEEQDDATTTTSTTAVTELATELGIYTTTKNFTTQRSPSTTSRNAEYSHLTGTVVEGTTSGAQPPTTVGQTTQTTWKGTTTSSGDNAACQLVIPGRFEVLSQQELEAYYGRRVIPTRLPADMVQPEIYEERGIYYKDEAVIAKNPGNWSFMLKQGMIRDAEIIYDENSYEWYSMENADRRLMVYVSTAPYPQNMLGDATRFNETTTVAGVEVKIHHYSDAPYSDTWCYSAVAQVDGVAFYVSAWEFTREEFLETLASLLEG